MTITIIIIAAYLVAMFIAGTATAYIGVDDAGFVFFAALLWPVFAIAGLVFLIAMGFVKLCRGMARGIRGEE